MTRGSEAEEVTLGEPGRRPYAQSAQRGKSVTRNLPPPPVVPLAAVTDSDARARAQAAAARISRLASALRTDALVSSHPSSLRDAHRRVHARAGAHDAWLVTVPALIWGYAWLGFKSLLHCLEWTTETFPRFAVTAVIVLLAYLFR